MTVLGSPDDMIHIEDDILPAEGMILIYSYNS
jgi:hypothetical protein